MELNVLKEESETGGAYRAIAESGTEAGHMRFKRIDPKTIIIDYTHVNEEFKGRGMAKKLLHRAISDARESRTKIVPVCSYVRNYFDGNPEDTADVRAEERSDL